MAEDTVDRVTRYTGEQYVPSITPLALPVFATSSGVASGNIHGSGSPVGVVTPDAVDQIYRDGTDGVWISTGTTTADWLQIV